jgi:hypothetical protein
MSKRFKKFLSYSIILSAIFTSVFSTNLTYANESRPDVSLVEAKKAAEYQILLERKTNVNSFWNVKSLSLEEPIPVFDNSGTIDSYIVNLSIDGTSKGFIEVSSNKDEYPILSFSFNDCSMSINNVTALKNKIKNNNSKITLQKVVRLSPGNYAIKQDYEDGTADIISNKISYKILKENNKNFKKEPLKNNNESRIMWENINKIKLTGDIGSDSDGVTDDISFETGTRSAYEISGVPDYNQYSYPTSGKDPSTGENYPWYGASGCAPTSASNVIIYHGLGDDTWDNTIVELRTDMGTTMTPDGEGSTYINMISTGIKSYMNAHNHTSAYVYDFSSPTWGTVKDALLNSNPDVITFTGQTYYCPSSGHTVTGVGTVEYTTNGSSEGHRYMEIHDNWGSTPETVFVAYGRNYSTLNVVKVVP